MVEEFKRWIDSGRCDVWTRHNSPCSNWSRAYCPSWNQDNIYIVNDKHTELRKIQADNPGIEFEVELVDGWTDVREPEWSLYNEYRVKVDPETETYFEVIDPIAKVILLIPSFGGIDISYIKTGRSFELPIKDL